MLKDGTEVVPCMLPWFPSSSHGHAQIRLMAMPMLKELKTQIDRLNVTLETHWVAPAYPGWVLLGLTFFFLSAAANTLAGWLYLLSGTGLALIGTAIMLPVRSLQGLTVERAVIEPVHAGACLKLALTLTNRTATVKALLQVQDPIPQTLGQPARTSIATIPAQGTHAWTYELDTHQRGIYRWQTLDLRTAAPLGLFWCCRARMAAAEAIVYPTVLSLSQCPIIDPMVKAQNLQFQHQRLRPQAGNEGATRSVRPYRWGDPMRLVHWRTSARHNELRTRELEVFTSQEQTVTMALDCSFAWYPDDFEQAVIAAASLYDYARHHHAKVALWTTGAGLQHHPQTIFKTLAQVQPNTVPQYPLPQIPVIWLSQNSQGLSGLPVNSRCLLWSNQRLQPESTSLSALPPDLPGLLIQPDQPLAPQLQGDVFQPAFS